MVVGKNETEVALSSGLTMKNGDIFSLAYLINVGCDWRGRVKVWLDLVIFLP